METAKYVTVLDFEDGNVVQYPLEPHCKYLPCGNASVDSQELQEILKELGHNLGNCKWMVHNNEPIIY